MENITELEAYVLRNRELWKVNIATISAEPGWRKAPRRALDHALRAVVYWSQEVGPYMVFGPALGSRDMLVLSRRGDRPNVDDEEFRRLVEAGVGQVQHLEIVPANATWIHWRLA